MKLKLFSQIFLPVTVTVIGSFVALPAASQEAVIEEIVVTAQKREQGLGDVPISMQVVSGDTLDEQNISDFKGLVERLPNVAMTESPFTYSLTMRGVGSGPANPAMEQAVSMFVDGVYVSRGYQFNAPFLDAGSIEVLKGPQGVLQGKNAVAGALLINSRRPTEETERFIRASYEFENQGHLVEAGISGAVADNLFMRLVVSDEEQGGWLDRTDRVVPGVGTVIARGGNDINERENTNIALSAVWEPRDDFSLYAKVSHGELTNYGPQFGTFSIQPDAVASDGLLDRQEPDGRRHRFNGRSDPHFRHELLWDAGTT